MIFYDKKKNEKYAIKSNECVYCGADHLSISSKCADCEEIFNKLNQFINKALERQAVSIAGILISTITEIEKIKGRPCQESMNITAVSGMKKVIQSRRKKKKTHTKI